MDCRLNKYYFKELETKNRRAFGWIKNHPVDAILWSMKMASHRTETNDNDDEPENSNEGLTREDQEELFMCNFDDNETEPADDTADQGQENQTPNPEDCQRDDDDQRAASWQRQLARALVSESENVFRKRVLKRLWDKAQDHLQHEEASRQEIHDKDLKAKQLWLRNLGISEEDIRKVNDPYEELPTDIQNKVMKKLAERKKEEELKQQKKDDKKIQKIFGQGSWLRRKELELHENVEIVHSQHSNDSEKYGAKGRIEILTEQLTSFHKGAGTYKMQKAIEARQRACMEMGILSESYKHLVTNLVDPLPLATECQKLDQNQDDSANQHEQDKEEDDDDDDDQGYATPPSSQMELQEQCRKRKEHPE